MIDFKMIGELTTKARHFDRLSLTEAAHVDARRGADENVDITRAVINDDDESKRQIIDDRARLHLWTTPVSFNLRDVDEHEQT